MERLRRKKAAEYLSMSKETLDKRRAAGKITAIKDGGMIFYEKTELDRYLNSLKVPQPAPVPIGWTYRKRRPRKAS